MNTEGFSILGVNVLAHGGNGYHGIGWLHSTDTCSVHIIDAIIIAD